MKVFPLTALCTGGDEREDNVKFNVKNRCFVFFLLLFFCILFMTACVSLSKSDGVSQKPKEIQSEQIVSQNNSLENPDATTPCSKDSLHNIQVGLFEIETANSIDFIISLDSSPNPVRSLGFDVIYDPGMLRYKNYTKGELIKKFDMFDVRKKQDGFLRVGGFEARDDLIPKGKSGELISISFDIIKKGKLDVDLIRLKDDIKSWCVGKNSRPAARKGEGKGGEMKKIKEDITRKGAKWEAGPTSISDLPPEERKKRMGIKNKND